VWPTDWILYHYNVLGQKGLSAKLCSKWFPSVSKK
jgi:hypothetical protein